MRLQRKAAGLSQKALGLRLCTSQPRVAQIDVVAADVSLDQLVRASAAAGGRIECPPRSHGKSGRLKIALEFSSPDSRALRRVWNPPAVSARIP